MEQHSRIPLFDWGSEWPLAHYSSDASFQKTHGKQIEMPKTAKQKHMGDDG
jgi:hypothetical protein